MSQYLFMIITSLGAHFVCISLKIWQCATHMQWYTDATLNTQHWWFVSILESRFQLTFLYCVATIKSVPFKNLVNHNWCPRTTCTTSIHPPTWYQRNTRGDMENSERAEEMFTGQPLVQTQDRENTMETILFHSLRDVRLGAELQLPVTIDLKIIVSLLKQH